ncbi:MAG: histidine kinase [Acidiferrobacterales bacterium]|jgi:two-component system sensor histidine kinase AlgZ|nr:histidine kinase [Acidiferrobacterales bacterium]
MTTLAQKAGLMWARLSTGLKRAPRVTPEAVEESAGFLPNFCRGDMLVNVVVIAQLLALVITLITKRISLNIFEDLLLISLFIQWIALSSAGAVCGLRRFLNQLPKLYALGATYVLLLLITVVISEAAVWLLWIMGKIPSPRPGWYSYFHVQNLSISIVVNALALRYLLGVHELQQRTASEERAKMQALKSRIRPHFVFNSLNIIASLTRSAPTKAEHAIEDMADLFRMMLTESENLVPVHKEVEVAQKYIALEQLRLDNRLTVNWDIGKFPRKAIMPVLTLQPLLENAIRFGVEPSPEGGTIDVRLWEEDESIHIQISNPMPRKRKLGRNEAPEGQALDDIRRRLQTHYGEDAKLAKQDNDGRFVVTVVLPNRGGTP